MFNRSFIFPMAAICVLALPTLGATQELVAEKH